MPRSAERYHRYVHVNSSPTESDSCSLENRRPGRALSRTRMTRLSKFLGEPRTSRTYRRGSKSQHSHSSKDRNKHSSRSKHSSSKPSSRRSKDGKLTARASDIEGTAARTSANYPNLSRKPPESEQEDGDDGAEQLDEQTIEEVPRNLEEIGATAVVEAGAEAGNPSPQRDKSKSRSRSKSKTSKQSKSKKSFLYNLLHKSKKSKNGQKDKNRDKDRELKRVIQMQIQEDHKKGKIIGKGIDGQNGFRIAKFIGRGSFGLVFAGIDLSGDARGDAASRRQKMVAIKVEANPKYDSLNLLHREFKIYQEIHTYLEDANKKGEVQARDLVGIPQVMWFGSEKCSGSSSGSKHYRYMVMEYLGLNLGKLMHKFKDEKFTLKTTCMVGIQVVDRMKSLHECGFIHRDIKPENFVIGYTDERDVIYVIDLGLVKHYCDPVTRVHNRPNTGRTIVGTVRYCSTASHEGFELGRKDDLESVLFMLAYFYLGKVPWQGIGRAERDDKINQKILELKKSFDKHLADVQAPNVFREYLANVRKLEYEEEPDYDALKNMFLEEMKSRNIACDMKFDWMDSAKARKSND